MQADASVRRGARAPVAPPPHRRPKPKQLDDEPLLFEPAQGGGGGTAFVGRRRTAPTGTRRPSGTAPVLSDDVAVLVAADGPATALDAQTVRRARQIARALAVPRPRPDVVRRRDSGTLISVRYRNGSDDIDLDATLERLVEVPVPDEDDIVVRDRVRTRRSVVLLVDVSGSMRGERVRTAAAAVGALAAELARDELAVVAFWSDAAVIAPLGRPTAPARLIESLLRIPVQGLTNVTFPLQVARRLLAGVSAHETRVLLLSDCVHNAGPDPRGFAAQLPRLDVLLDTSGEHDLGLSRDLARLGRGRLVPAHSYRDVAPALTTMFAG